MSAQAHRCALGVLTVVGVTSLVLAAGCASSTMKGRAAQQSPTPTPAGAAPKPAEAPGLALAHAVTALAAGAPATVSEAVAVVLLRLADCLDERSPGAAQRVRAAETRLEPAGDSPAAAAALKSALEEAHQALLMAPPPAAATLPRYQTTLAAVPAAVEAIDPAVALSQQLARIVSGLRLTTDALFLLRGDDAPFGMAALVAAPPTSSQGYGALLAEVRASLRKLRQRPWSEERILAAATFDQLAQMLRVLPGRAQGDRQVVARIGLQAQKLRSPNTVRFREGGCVKAALTAALDGVPAPIASSAALEVWMTVAREAITDVDDNEGFAFQRAVVQDAFRTTIDVLAQIPR